MGAAISRAIHVLVLTVLLSAPGLPIPRLTSGSPASDPEDLQVQLRAPGAATVWLVLQNKTPETREIDLRWTAPRDHMEKVRLAPHRFVYLRAPEPPKEASDSAVTYRVILERARQRELSISWVYFDPAQGVVQQPWIPQQAATYRIEPVRVPAQRRTTLKLQGPGLSRDCTAREGDQPLPVVWRAPDRIEIVLPPGPAGTVDLEVRCNDRKINLAQAPRRVLRRPQIDSVTWRIDLDGTLLWSIYGDHFNATDTVWVDDQAVTTRFISPRSLRARQDRVQPGLHRIRVSGADGASSGEKQVTLNWVPRVSEVHPPVLAPGTGGPVTLTGTDLTPDLLVTLGDHVLGTEFRSSHLITFQAPPMPAGRYPLQLVDATGLHYATSVEVVYNAAPEIERIDVFPRTVVRLSRVELKAIVIDPEGDPLFYQWEVLQGPVAQMRWSDDRATIDVADHAEPLVIRCTVRDALGNTTSKTLRIEVM